MIPDVSQKSGPSPCDFFAFLDGAGRVCEKNEYLDGAGIAEVNRSSIRRTQPYAFSPTNTPIIGVSSLYPSTIFAKNLGYSS